MAVTWTEERVAALTKLWESGATASAIAAELGGVSRNAVIGKAHRLGLKARPSPVKRKTTSKTKPATKQAAKAAAPAAIPEKPATRAPAPASVATPAAEAPTPAPKAAPASPKAEPAKPAQKSSPAATAKSTPAAEEPKAKAEQSIPVPPGSTPQQMPKIISVGPGGFLRQGPGDQQAPIPPAPPRRLVPAKPSPEIADKTSLLDLNERVCRWPMGHPGEPDFHFCGEKVNPGFPYCVEHCGRAYQAQLPRGVRRPPPPLPFGGPRVR